MGGLGRGEEGGLNGIRRVGGWVGGWVGRTDWVTEVEAMDTELVAAAGDGVEEEFGAGLAFVGDAVAWVERWVGG